MGTFGKIKCLNFFLFFNTLQRLLILFSYNKLLQDLDFFKDIFPHSRKAGFFNIFKGVIDCEHLKQNIFKGHPVGFFLGIYL